MENRTEWQALSLDFESDGEASTTIQLVATHTSAGSEKIIGWDNVKIIAQIPDAIEEMSNDRRNIDNVYDLNGRRTSASSKGIVITRGKKMLRP